LRELLRVVLRVVLRPVEPARVPELLRAPVFRVAVLVELFVVLFLRAGPRLAAVLLAPALRAPVLRAPALRAVVLRVPVLRVLVAALLPVRLRLVLRVPLLRADVDDALRATVLRVLRDADFEPRLAPVREPAVRPELLLDDFLVAMLYSGAMLDQPT